jgi:hypothetical protein
MMKIEKEPLKIADPFDFQWLVFIFQLSFSFVYSLPNPGAHTHRGLSGKIGHTMLLVHGHSTRSA